MLSREMQLLIRELDTPSSEISLRSALNTVILLGNEGSNHLCSLLAREGGVRCLLRHCHLIYSPLPSMNNLNSSQSSPITVPADEIRILALRGLSSICCVAECIREFEQVLKRLYPILDCKIQSLFFDCSSEEAWRWFMSCSAHDSLLWKTVSKVREFSLKSPHPGSVTTIRSTTSIPSLLTWWLLSQVQRFKTKGRKAHHFYRKH